MFQSKLHVRRFFVYMKVTIFSLVIDVAKNLPRESSITSVLNIPGCTFEDVFILIKCTHKSDELYLNLLHVCSFKLKSNFN